MPHPHPLPSSPRAKLAALLIALLGAGGCGSAADGPGGQGADASEAPDLIIEEVTVIDAVNGARSGMRVVVDDGRITAVESAETSWEGADPVAMVAGEGAYLIPGLWDFHVHLSYDARFTDAMPEMFLRYGITSVRDTGGMLDLVLPIVERMEAEGALAPRVFFAGPLLDGEHVVYDGDSRPEIGITTPDVETARANVARLAEAGVDFIKVYEMITPEVFAALVEESDARGLPRDGHVPLSMLARDVGPSMQSLEHLRNIEMDCAADAEARLAQRRAALEAWTTDDGPGGDLRSALHSEHRLPSVAAYDAGRCAETIAALSETIQVPTLRLNALGIAPPWMRNGWDAALDASPADAGADWRAAGERQRTEPPARDTTFGAFSMHLIGMMHEAGVPIAAGTDTPIGFAIPGFSLHNELDMLVRSGLDPLEALRAATIRPAQFFGLDGEMGTIEAGMMADLVLLSANPLDDITNTLAIEAVVTKGRLLSGAELEGMGGGR